MREPWWWPGVACRGANRCGVGAAACAWCGVRGTAPIARCGCGACGAACCVWWCCAVERGECWGEGAGDGAGDGAGTDVCEPHRNEPAGDVPNCGKNGRLMPLWSLPYSMLECAVKWRSDLQPELAMTGA